MTPFVVFSLPRSRSAWLSTLMSAPDRIIGHDIAATSETMDDFMARLGAGSCETGMAFAWRAIRRRSPDVRFAVVRRDPAEVIESLDWFGLTGLDAEIRRRDAQLDEIAAQPGTLSFLYRELSQQDACGRLYEHCLAKPMPTAWWQALDPLNIQVDMHRQVALLNARANETAAFCADAERAAA